MCELLASGPKEDVIACAWSIWQQQCKAEGSSGKPKRQTADGYERQSCNSTKNLLSRTGLSGWNHLWRREFRVLVENLRQLFRGVHVRTMFVVCCRMRLASHGCYSNSYDIVGS